MSQEQLKVHRPSRLKVFAEEHLGIQVTPSDICPNPQALFDRYNLSGLTGDPQSFDSSGSPEKGWWKSIVSQWG